MRNAQRGALRSFWALVYKGDQKALERFLVCRRTCRDQESSPASSPCAMPYVCGSGVERANEATANSRITEDAIAYGRSL